MLTCPRTKTELASTREGLVFFSDFLSFSILKEGVESCVTCSCVKMLHKGQYYFKMHGSKTQNFFFWFLAWPACNGNIANCELGNRYHVLTQ